MSSAESSAMVTVRKGSRGGDSRSRFPVDDTAPVSVEG